MKKLGSLMFFFGVGSSILYFLDRECVFLMWIDTFGPIMAWVIRVAPAVVGGLIWLMSPDPEIEAE